MRAQTVEKIISVAIACAEVFTRKVSQTLTTATFFVTAGPGTPDKLPIRPKKYEYDPVLGVVWCHFWASSGLFGGSWGDLGRSWAVLGRPLVAATPRLRYSGRFLDHHGASEGAKTEPKTTKNRS